MQATCGGAEISVLSLLSDLRKICAAFHTGQTEIEGRSKGENGRILLVWYHNAGNCILSLDDSVQ